MPPRITLTNVETELGPMLVAASRRGILAISDGDDAGPMLAEVRRRLPDATVLADDRATDATAWLVGWADGSRRDPAPLDVRGLSAFDADVYRAVAAIGWGERATYGEIALRVNRPGAARAVGGAMARCPLFPAVPCHRVVRAADGWSGWGTSGNRRKRALLARESD